MRDEMRDERADEEVGWLIKEGLTRAVEAESERLDRIERNVIETLRSRPERRSIFAWLRLPALPAMRPAWALAAACLIFLIGFLSGIIFQNGSPQTPGQGVLFVVAFPEAQEVQLAGDFTKWEPIALKRDDRGMWSIKMDLAPGRHEYVFIVNGERMVTDPRAHEYVKSYNHINSVIFVS